MTILRKSRAIATTVAVALGLAFAAPASAQPTAPPTAPKAPDAAAPAAKPAPKPAEAKGLFAAGEKKFKASDFAGALQDFEASYAAKPEPATQRFIALSHDNLQQYLEAAAAYEKFIAENPPKMQAEVDEAKKRLEAIQAMPGKVVVETTPPGASIVIDTAEAPYEQVTPVEIELSPGKHTLLIGAQGYENTTREIEVGFASKQELKAELEQKPPPPEPPPPPVVAEAPAPEPAPPPAAPEPRSKVPAYVTGAVAIAAAGVGTAFGVMALGDASDYKKTPTTKLADSGENNALIADMMFGVAITFGVTSAVLFLSNDAPETTASAGAAKTASAKKTKKKKKTMTIIPAPYVTPTGGGAGAYIQF